MISLLREQSSWLHRRRAGVKLSALCGLSLLVYPLQSPVELAPLLLLVGAGYVSLGRGGLGEMWVVRGLWPWFAVMFVIHAFAGQPVYGLVVVLKMLLMILAANLLTLTTRLADLLATLEFALQPLRWVGLSTRPLSLALSLMIRYVPVLLAMLAQHREAWQARGGGEHGRWRLLVPALIGALRLAESAGDALAARGGARGLAPKRR